MTADSRVPVPAPPTVTDEMAMACAMAIADEMSRQSGNFVSMDLAPEILAIYKAGIQAALDVAEVPVAPAGVDKVLQALRDLRDFDPVQAARELDARSEHTERLVAGLHAAQRVSRELLDSEITI